MVWHWNRNSNENIQPPVDLETVTKYSAILFVNLGEYIPFNLCNNNNKNIAAIRIEIDYTRGIQYVMATLS